jgi:molybdopterin synthase sulfur carrier subunit
VIRVVLPGMLRALARIGPEVELDARPTIAGVIDALESRYPMLRGTLRDHRNGKRRPYIRFFACRRDLSFDSLEAELPAAVVAGDEAFLVVGAMSGG